MKKKKKLIICLLLLALIATVLVIAFSMHSKTKTVTVLQTSDVHGMLVPYDYIRDESSDTSLANAATAIEREREDDPNLLLIDTGDITQGNFVQNLRNRSPHPSVQAMNYLDYDAWVLGNHEFNFEYDSLLKSVDEFQGVTLCGNMYKDDRRVFPASNIFNVNGIKVAIIGLTAPHVQVWEKQNADHYDNASFAVPDDELNKELKILRGKADIVIAAVHYGPKGEYGERGMFKLAKKYSKQIDAFLIGHSHSLIDKKIDDIPILEPGTKAESISKLSFELEERNGKWEIIECEGDLIDCSNEKSDAAYMAEMSECEKKLKSVANTAIGTIGETYMDPIEFLPGIPYSLIQDTPIVDFVNIVQLSKCGTDISCATLSNPSVNLTKGTYKYKDSASVYPYEDTLCAVKITGAQLKTIMEEYAGAPFRKYKEGDVTIAFNPDMGTTAFDRYAGIDYEIDISKPVGKRIKNIMYHNEALSDDQELTMAISSYRSSQLVKNGIIDEKQIYWNGDLIRDYLSEYVASHKGELYPECDNNWRIVGAELEDPQKELIYQMVRKGELIIQDRKDKSTVDIKALNGPELRDKGILPPLKKRTDQTN